MGIPVSPASASFVVKSRTAMPSAAPKFRGEEDQKPQLPAAQAKAGRYYEPKPWKAFIRTVVGASRWGFAKPVLGFDVKISDADREKLRALAKSGHSVIVTPNHVRKMLDILTMMELGRQTGIDCASMVARERFEAFPPFSQKFWQWMGGFSVDRSAASKQDTLAEALNVVESGQALLLFPNAAPLGFSRDVGPMKNGFARVAIDSLLSDRLKSAGVKVVPMSLFYEHKGDLTSVLDGHVSRLEAHARKNFPIAPLSLGSPEEPLEQRIKGLFKALIEERGHTLLGKRVSIGAEDLHGQLAALVEAAMDRMEARYNIVTDPFQPVSWRTSTVTGIIKERLREVENGDENNLTAQLLKIDLKTLRDIRRLSLFPKDYLKDGNPDRMFDMVVRLHEAITGKEMDVMTASKGQRVTVDVHEPIDVAAFLRQHHRGGSGEKPENALTETVRATLQAALDRRDAKPASSKNADAEVTVAETGTAVTQNEKPPAEQG